MGYIMFESTLSTSCVGLFVETIGSKAIEVCFVLGGTHKELLLGLKEFDPFIGLKYQGHASSSFPRGSHLTLRLVIGDLTLRLYFVLIYIINIMHWVVCQNYKVKNL
jgi:hypothetical protein